MEFLIDTNIVLDFLLQREPFYQDAERLFQAIHDNNIDTAPKLSKPIILEIGDRRKPTLRLEP